MDKFEQYLDNNRMYCFEGSAGIRNLNKLIKEICGYGRVFGDPITVFLEDNPGAIQAIVEWIQNNVETVDEWNINLNELVEETDEIDDE